MAVEDLNRYRNLVEEALEGYLRANACVPALHEAMVYAASGGKRLRGSLVLGVCEDLGGKAEDALGFAAAVEMVQAYSLVHDDLPCMDDDDMRRGKPTCHKQFGEALALLCGDGLLTLAFDVICSANLPPDRVVEGTKVLARAAGPRGMVGGQVMDLALENGLSGPDPVKKMYRLKTGELFGASACLGAVAAGADANLKEAARAWGLSFGYAYQILDDLEDACEGGKEDSKDTLVKETSAAQAAREAEKAFFLKFDASPFATGLARHYRDQLGRYTSEFASDA